MNPGESLRKLFKLTPTRNFVKKTILEVITKGTPGEILEGTSAATWRKPLEDIQRELSARIQRRIRWGFQRRIEIKASKRIPAGIPLKHPLDCRIRM